ncbi:MAG: DUF4112 domain-containing protein [Acidobacteria bacterium]|jgi:hypothetical protein|nr:DUF4112 domain-containing protein [Acidobacteriota bacterium]
MKKIEELQPIENRARFGTAREERKQIELEESLENLSRYLDNWIKIPVVGWRFGLDALIGLVPNVGDTLTSFASFYILLAGVRYGVPKITLLRMAFNIGLDYIVGVIPFIGDTFDLFWKSNKRNMDLIRERATGKDKGTTGDYLFVGLIILALIVILVGSILVSVYILWELISKIFGVQ